MRVTEEGPARRPRVAEGADLENRTLAVWRLCDPGEIEPATLAEVERAVVGSALLLHHRRWPEALRGDPTAIVAAGVDVLQDHPTGAPAFDLAMSGLLVHAARGDATAALVLAHGLAALAHMHPRAEELLDRADRWSRRWPRRRPAPPTRG